MLNFIFWKRPGKLLWILLSILVSPLNTSSILAENLNLLMGNPSHATTDWLNKDNFLMEKESFTLSYNNSKGTPNWVSWRLTKEDIGNAPRFPFYPDYDLPRRRFIRILPSDYNKSGFDRGHICPHADRSADEDMSEETFVMTNMVPQSPNLNRKTWNQLEMYCRSLAKRGKTLYMIAGPNGQGGTGELGFKEVIGKRHKITVPSKCWKVIMVLNSKEGNDIDQVSADTRLIAVIIPNDMSVNEDWAKFRVSVSEVEALTGYTFFSNVPKEIIEPLKKTIDNHPISRPRYKRDPNRPKRIHSRANQLEYKD